MDLRGLLVLHVRRPGGWLLKILYHGTGAHRRQSLEEKGLVPRLGPDDPGVIYATDNPLFAALFAAARGDRENCKGLILKFEAGKGWEKDPRFPDSFMRREGVRPEEISTTLLSTRTRGS